MGRSLFTAILICFTPVLSADEDPIRAKLDQAIAAYDTAIATFKSDVEQWFEKEEEAARKLRTGVTEQIKKIENERTEFAKFWVLPSRAPKKLINTPTDLADTLIAAYKLASDDYSRIEKDSEAAAVEKELEELLASDKVVGDYRRGDFTEIIRERIKNNALAIGKGKLILTPKCTLTKATQQGKYVTLVFTHSAENQRIGFHDLIGVNVHYKPNRFRGRSFTVKTDRHEEKFVNKGVLTVRFEGVK